MTVTAARKSVTLLPSFSLPPSAPLRGAPEPSSNLAWGAWHRPRRMATGFCVGGQQHQEGHIGAQRDRHWRASPSILATSPRSRGALFHIRSKCPGRMGLNPPQFEAVCATGLSFRGSACRHCDTRPDGTISSICRTSGKAAIRAQAVLGVVPLPLVSRVRLSKNWVHKSRLRVKRGQGSTGWYVPIPYLVKFAWRRRRTTVACFVRGTADLRHRSKEALS